MLPNILNNNYFLTNSFDFRVEDKVILQFLYTVKNYKLLKLLSKLNHKAQLGFTAAAAEWCFWRLVNIPDVDKERLNNSILSIEPLWAGIINKDYLYVWKYDKTDKNSYQAQMDYIVLNATNFIAEFFCNGYPCNNKVCDLIMLARFITPDKKLFDAWFRDCYQTALALFPCQDEYNYYGTKETARKPYDSSDEPIIPRAFFFEEGFDYRSADIPKLADDFLKSLSPITNPFLYTPDQMQENGFKGVPYQYSVKGV